MSQRIKPVKLELGYPGSLCRILSTNEHQKLVKKFEGVGNQGIQEGVTFQRSPNTKLADVSTLEFNFAMKLTEWGFRITTKSCIVIGTVQSSQFYGLMVLIVEEGDENFAYARKFRRNEMWFYEELRQNQLKAV